MMNHSEAENLLTEWIENENLQHHCRMVAEAMKAYAVTLEKDEKTLHNWWLAGLLHDLDWEKKPKEHPNYALEQIFPNYEIDEEVCDAIRAHAPERTGKEAETEIERYLFACDELSGFLYAVSLMRPTGFEGMKVKSVTKKMKDAKFAASVSRYDMHKGADLIDKSLADHITFLISVFDEMHQK